jgi:HlyD family secretion protein
MKKVVIKVVIACLIVGGLGTGGYYGYNKYKASKATVSTAARYVTMKTTKTNLELKIQGTGAVFAGTSKEVTTSSVGEIKDLNVNIGDTVAKDSTLFTISNDSLQQAIDKAQVALDKQKLQLSNAKSTLTTAQQTLADAETAAANPVTTTTGQNNNNSSTKVITVADAQAAVTKAKLDVNSAELTIKDAERDLTTAKENKNKAIVKSPIDGLVIAKTKNSGDTVQANASILTVIDTNSFKVKVAVDELDIQKVKVGQKTSISIGAITGKTYEGTVEQIALTGTSSNNVTTYDVTVAIANPENIKIGMNATVNISIENKENVLVIPTDALVTKNDKKYVMVPSTDGSSVAATGSSSKPTNNAAQSTPQTQNNGQGTSQQAGTTGTNSAPTSSQNAANGTNTRPAGQARQNGQTRQNAGTGTNTNSANVPVGAATASIPGKLVEIKTGLVTETYIEVVEGLTEGQQVMVTLPQTSTTTTSTNKNNTMGGLGGNAGGFNVPTGGNANRQPPTGGAAPTK